MLLPGLDILLFIADFLVVMKKKRRRLVGNIFMVMFSDTLKTCPCFVVSWVLERNC